MSDSTTTVRTGSDSSDQRRVPVVGPYRDAVWDSQYLTPVQRLVALCYADHHDAGPTGLTAWVVTSRLMARCGTLDGLACDGVHCACRGGDVADEVDPLDGLARSLADHVLRAASTGGPTLAELGDGSTAELMALVRDYAGHEVDADMVAQLGERVYGPIEAKSADVLTAIEAEVRRLYAIAWSADLMAKNFEHATGGYGPGGLTPRALYEAVKVWRSARDA